MNTLPPRRHGKLAAGLFLLALGLYVANTPPDVHYGGDCGEMACSAWCLGVGHPTGYPLYMMLGKLMTLIVPFGSVIWRVVLVSAAGAALAVALVGWLVAEATDDRVAASLAAVVLACDNTFYSQAVIAEVYGLSMAFLALLLLAHVQWYRTRDVRWVNVLGLAYGLGVVHHVSLVFNLPVTLLFFVVACWRRDAVLAGLREVGGHALRAAVWLLALFPIYVYEPLRAALRPPMNWGDTATWAGFLRHITGRMYAETLLNVSASDALRFASNQTRILGYDQGWAVVLAVLAAVALWRRRAPLALLVCGVAATSLYFAAHYNVGDRFNYTLPAHLALAVAAGFGAAQLAAWLRASLAGRLDQPRTFHALVATVLLLLPALPAPPFWVTPVRRSYDFSSMRGNRRAAEQIDGLLSDLPTGAHLLLALDEQTNALWYRQLVDGIRRDVQLVQFSYLNTPDQRTHAIEWTRYALERSPTYLGFYEPFIAPYFGFRMAGSTVEAVPPERAPWLPWEPLPVLQSQALPDCPRWQVAGGAVGGPVQLHTPDPRPNDHVTGLRSRLLSHLDLQLTATAPQAAADDLLVLCVHKQLAQQLRGELARVPEVLNESTGKIWRAWPLRWPLRPQRPTTAAEVGLSLRVRCPLWAPDAAVGGDYEVRAAVFAANDPRWTRIESDPEEFYRATVPIGWARLYGR